jgi:hypothetical protein
MGRVLKYHGKEFRYTMNRESDISWVGGQNTLDRVFRFTMGMEVKIPQVAGLIYNG